MNKFRILTVLILVCILVGCTDNSELERLQNELDELKEQINTNTENPVVETTFAQTTEDYNEQNFTISENVITEVPILTDNDVLENTENEQIEVNRRAYIINTLPTLFETPSVGGRRLADVPYNTIAMVYYQIPLDDSGDMRFRYVYGDYWINIGYTNPDTGEYLRGYTGINAIEEWVD